MITVITTRFYIFGSMENPGIEFGVSFKFYFTYTVLDTCVENIDRSMHAIGQNICNDFIVRTLRLRPIVPPRHYVFTKIQWTKGKFDVENYAPKMEKLNLEINFLDKKRDQFPNHYCYNFTYP